MQLSALLPALADARVVGTDDVEIGGIAHDTRKLERGDLFVALPGEHVDGHRFIEAAVARGAAAVLCQYEPGGDPPVPHVVVPDTRSAMADLAAAFYDYPADRLQVIGVTGTDGKTTTSFLLHAVLQGTGHQTGLISTVAFRIGDRSWFNDTRWTTPAAPEIQRHLATMAAARMEYAIVESSSHALALDRLRNCYFDCGVFTNLTSDHLDFHRTLDNYREAKALLFRDLGQRVKPHRAAPLAILNRDDSHYEYMRTVSAAPVLSYGLHQEADVRAANVQAIASGLRFRAITPYGEVAVRSPLTGRFNVHNLLAALALAVARGIDPAAAAEALATMPGVPGRMQRIDLGQPFTVIVDFAHTADSLAKVLDELRPLTAGRLIVVFGAAGEHDRGKRPAMGRIAAERCDLVILTDEDPYLEDRLAIIEDIAAGARETGARDGETLLKRPNRHDAIETAVASARAGDTLLVAGKGHENCIITGTERLPWSDEEAVRGALALRMEIL